MHVIAFILAIIFAVCTLFCRSLEEAMFRALQILGATALVFVGLLLFGAARRIWGF